MTILSRLGRWLLCQNEPRTPRPLPVPDDLSQAVEEAFGGQSMVDLAEANQAAAEHAHRFAELVLLPVFDTPGYDLGGAFADVMQDGEFDGHWVDVLFWTSKMLVDAWATIGSMVDEAPGTLARDAINAYRAMFAEECQRMRTAPPVA